ncbi:MAG TPA: acyl carrier protein [Opitutaceae bacterium]
MKEQIRAFIQSLVGTPDPAIAEQTPLYSGGVLSSMAHLKLVQFLERRFDVAIPMWEVSIDNFDTVEQIAAYVESKKSATA